MSLRAFVGILAQRVGGTQPEWVRAAPAALAGGKARAGVHVQQALVSQTPRVNFKITAAGPVRTPRPDWQTAALASAHGVSHP